jgi:hypothetical protein
MLASGAAILIAVYQVEVKSTAWLEVDVPEAAPNVLVGSLSVVVLYYLVAFVFFAIADLQRWRSASLVLHLHHFNDISQGVRKSIAEYGRALEKAYFGPQSCGEAERISVRTLMYLDRVDEQVAKLLENKKVLTSFQITRLTLFDLGLPVALGVFAFAKVASAFSTFVGALWV